MFITSEEEYADLCGVLTWYEHVPAQWKDPAYCRDSKVFERIRQACLKYERMHYSPVSYGSVPATRSETV